MAKGERTFFTHSQAVSFIKLFLFHIFKIDDGQAGRWKGGEEGPKPSSSDSGSGSDSDLEIWLTERTHLFPGTLGIPLGTPSDTGTLVSRDTGTLELVPGVPLGLAAVGLFHEYDSDAETASN